MRITLQTLTTRLTATPNVAGLVAIGSTAHHRHAHSDIDFLVILYGNPDRLRSIYTFVTGTFAEFFFCNVATLRRLLNSRSLCANEWDGTLYSWIRAGTVLLDRTGHLARLKAARPLPLLVPTPEARAAWTRINYMRVENERYFRSQLRGYHGALTLQLGVAVSDLVTAYFQLRGLPWRGEREALLTLRHRSPALLSALGQYSQASTLPRRMAAYRRAFSIVVTKRYPRWARELIVPMVSPEGYSPRLRRYWRQLTA